MGLRRRPTRLDRIVGRVTLVCGVVVGLMMLVAAGRSLLLDGPGFTNVVLLGFGGGFAIFGAWFTYASLVRGS